MNYAFSLIFVCFFVNLIKICEVRFIEPSLINQTWYPESVLKGLSDKDKFNLHHAFVPEKLKWRDGVVHYKLSKAFNERQITEIKNVMDEIERSSCIRFIEHVGRYGPNYVLIEKDDYSERNWRCGRDYNSNTNCLHGGEVVAWLNWRSIYFRNILGLLLHVLGFEHHHNRSDRDKYIDIHPENIIDEEADNKFKNYMKLIPFDKSFKYLTPFDFDSVLLFSAHDMTKNHEPVITPKNEDVRMRGVSITGTLSKYDKILLNHFYGCAM